MSVGKFNNLVSLFSPKTEDTLSENKSRIISDSIDVKSDSEDVISDDEDVNIESNSEDLVEVESVKDDENIEYNEVESDIEEVQGTTDESVVKSRNRPKTSQRTNKITKGIQPSPVNIPIRINGKIVDISENDHYKSIRLTEDNRISTYERGDMNKDTMLSPRRNKGNHVSNIKDSSKVLKDDSKVIKDKSEVLQGTSSNLNVKKLPMPPPGDKYVYEKLADGKHKVIRNAHKKPKEGAIYHRVRIPHITGIVDKIPDNVDESKITIEQLEGHVRQKRYMLYRRIPVKFNQTSFIKWDSFSDDFKRRMYGEIMTKYKILLNKNEKLLGDLTPYMRNFDNISDLYQAYIDLRTNVDNIWMKEMIYTGMILLYTGIGYYLDHFHDLNTKAAINLIINNGISRELVNNLDFSPKISKKIIHGGGVPIILKLIIIIIVNVVIVYIACRYIDNDSFHESLGDISQAATGIVSEGKIDMSTIVQAGTPFIGLIANKMGGGLGALGGMFGSMSNNSE